MEVTATNFLKQASTTAEHFGFKNIATVQKHPSCKHCSKKLAHTVSAPNRRNDAQCGLLTMGLQHYCDAKLHAIEEEPILFYTIEQVPRTGEAAISLQIFNVPKSIAETILIQTTKSLAHDLGYTNQTIRINSVGDRDSCMRYTRELTNYLKKRMDEMPEQSRELMKDHALVALSDLIQRDHELAYKTPNPLEYLTDSSRKHFREVIEYLDIAESQYEIDPTLMGHHDCYSETLFTIDLLDEDDAILEKPPISINGGRYDEFAHQHTKRQIPAVGAVVVLADKKSPSRTPRAKLNKQSVYVVQLGFGPKIKSLLLVDELSKSGIRVYQNLASNSLSEQLRDAEKKDAYYTVIIGQKEYVDGEVILRDMNSRTQEQLTIDELIAKLRRSSKVVSM